MNNRVISIKRQKNFQLQLSTFVTFQLQLQQNRVINYNFVNCNYKFSKPGKHHSAFQIWCSHDFWVKNFTLKDFRHKRIEKIARVKFGYCTREDDIM